MEGKPAVSVVIPLYQKAAFIERALSSVAAQSVSDFEVIVVDDGSTDGGGELVRRWPDKRVRCLGQRNAGVSAARNTGIRAARADLVAFLDADDEWRPWFLETILRLRARFPRAGLFGTNYTLTVHSGRTRLRQEVLGAGPFPWEGVLENYYKAAVLGQWPIHPSAAAAPKAVLQSVGGFPPGEKVGEDAATFMRIAWEHPVGFSQVIGSHYRLDASSRPFCWVDSVAEARLFARTARDLLASRRRSDELAYWLKEFAARSCCNAASTAVLCGHGGLARSLLRDCETRHFVDVKRRWLALSFLPSHLVRELQRRLGHAAESWA